MWSEECSAATQKASTALGRCGQPEELAVAVAFYVYLWLTPSGYELRSVGLNPEAARFSGINPRRPLLSALLLGGASAGLAGAVQVAGRTTPYALYTGLSNVLNYGYNGIGVALIGRNHPIGIIVAGLFFGTLQAVHKR